MEPNNTPPLAAQQTPPPPPPPYPRSKTVFMFFGAVILLGIGLLGGYLFFAPKNTQVKNSQEEKKGDKITTVSPTALPSPMISPTAKVSAIPSDWTYIMSQECNVSFPLPPKKEPYYIPAPTGVTPDLMQDQGGFWQYGKNTSGGMFINYSYLHFFNENWGGSEYFPGFIQVSCSPNSTGYTNESLLSTYENDYKNGKYAGPEGPLVFTNQGLKTMWGRPAIAYTINGGMGPDNGLNTHYLFATKKHIYTVSKMIMSQNQSVKDSTEKIFQNLKFND